MFDVIAITETKLDESFPKCQFKLQGFNNPYRLDINSKSGGLLVYVNNDIPSRLLKGVVLSHDCQIVPVELNLRKQKWLIVSIYRPPRHDISQFISDLSKILDFYKPIYERVLVVGDFNSEPCDREIIEFINNHLLYNHMHQKTCWKSSKGSCIDLILSNQKHSLQNTGTLETGLSDHHLLIYTMLKCKYYKLPPKTINYRSYKHFDQAEFTKTLEYSLPNVNNYEKFDNILERTLDKFAPVKSKIIRGNHKPHANRILCKAIMERSRLKSKANKSKDPEDMEIYRRHRTEIMLSN